VLNLAEVEEICDSRGTTLVMHPAIRRAVRAYEESFYVGACAFLRGDADGVFLLPLENGGHVRLAFSKRCSRGGRRILRLDATDPGDLARIKQQLGQAAPI
jgi:hypothetical protein